MRLMSSIPSISGRFSRWAALLAVGACLIPAVDCFAQAKQPDQSVPTSRGTIAEVKKKGTLTTLVVLNELGGDPFEVPLLPTLPLAIEAKGDIGFLREKQFAVGTGFVSNGTLNVQKWTVHVGSNAKKMQPSSRQIMDGDDKKPLAGVKYYEVGAFLMSVKPDDDDPARQVAMLKGATPKGSPAYFEKNATITVSTNDLALIKDGLEVEYVVAGGSPKRPKIGALKVMLATPLKSAEFFAAEEAKDPKKK